MCYRSWEPGLNPNVSRVRTTNGAVVIPPAAPAPPPPYDHTIAPRATGATLTVDIPAGSPTLTWRMSKDPLSGGQTGFYDSTTAKGDNVVVNTTSTLLRGTRYYYQLESGNRSTVVASGTFTTLP